MGKRKKQGEEIIELLMHRDGITRAEAKDRYEYAREEFHEALAGNGYRDPEDVLAEELGIEMDYIFEFI